MSGKLRIIRLHENPRKRKSKPARARKKRPGSPLPSSRSGEPARAGAIAAFATAKAAKQFGQAWADKHRCSVRVIRSGSGLNHYVVPVKA